MANAGTYLGPHIRTGANSYLMAPIPITAPRLTPLSNLGRVSAGINDEYRRGTSLGSDKLSPLTPFIWDDFVNEHRYKKTEIDAEYTPIFNALTAETLSAIEQKKEFAKQGLVLNALNSAQKDLETTVKVIEEKEFDYETKNEEAFSMYGLNPLFLMIDLPFRKIYDGVHQGVEGFNKALVEIDGAYKAALDQKRLSLENNILASQLPALAQKIDELENSITDDSGRIASWASDRLSVINVEKNVRLSSLAYFHQEAIIKATGNVDDLTRSQSLEKYIAAIDGNIAVEMAAIGSYAIANPSIKSPLSKPELEALHTLIDLQTNTTIGKRWLDYHISLLHTESARQLTDISNAFKSMLARAREAEAKKLEDKQKEAYLSSVNFVAGANEKALQKYGSQLSGIAKDLQANVTGKNVRSYKEAIATFEKFKSNPRAQLNAQDRQAIATALNALDKATFADSVNRLGKAFGVVGKIVQAQSLYEKTVHGVLVDDWKPLMLELESIALGIGAGAIIAFITAIFLAPFATSAAGILTVSVLMAGAASYLDAKKVDEINNFIMK